MLISDLAAKKGLSTRLFKGILIIVITTCDARLYSYHFFYYYKSSFKFCLCYCRFLANNNLKFLMLARKWQSNSYFRDEGVIRILAGQVVQLSSITCELHTKLYF